MMKKRMQTIQGSQDLSHDMKVSSLGFVFASYTYGLGSGEVHNLQTEMRKTKRPQEKHTIVNQKNNNGSLTRQKHFYNIYPTAVKHHWEKM